jgi:3-hydroxyacyl-CoA dehydrogenase
MGGGIAMAFANAGLPVTLIEVSRAALDRGLGVIRRNYEGSAAKGRMTLAEVEERMARIAPAVDPGAAAGADLVIEAVYEDMATKQALFAALDGVAKPGAILASNTSYLDLDAIAGRTARPESVIGLHFFSPANVMRLLEIVRGQRTSDAVLATALALARTIGKVPVVSRVGPGFIANRVMSARRDQALQLLLEGTPAQEIDRALEDFGFAMGPFAMSDLVGLDVLGRGVSERTLQGDLVKLGRLGQKQGGGYYDYDEQRRPAPSPVAERAIAEFARFRGIAPQPPHPAETIVRRLLAPVVNEGAKLLAEGIAIRASDIDVACILGYNWPVYTGGPMFWADAVGLPQLVGVLREIGVAPAPLLAEKAAVGGGFTRG